MGLQEINEERWKVMEATRKFAVLPSATRQHRHPHTRFEKNASDGLNPGHIIRLYPLQYKREKTKKTENDHKAKDMHRQTLQSRNQRG